MPNNYTQFEDLLLRSSNQVGLCVILVLMWISRSDGEISPEEEELMRTVWKEHPALEISSLTDIARLGQTGDIQLACECLRQLSDDEKWLFLQLAVAVSLADGLLVTAECHILLFLADVIGVHKEGLDSVFEQLTGHDFPQPSDPSRMDWWESRENDRDSNRERPQSNKTGNTNVSMERLRQLATLGLDENANHEDIRSAYRRMAMIHHPDRYASLGPEAIAAAELTMRRINAAYKSLLGT